MLSNVEARMYFPFGENLTKLTGGLSSSMRVLRHCPVEVSQIRISPSYEHDTINVPSRLKQTADTGSECAGRVRRHFPNCNIQTWLAS